jgi:glucose-1-phosphatase
MHREGSTLEKTADSLKVMAFDLGNVLVKVDHGSFCRGLGEAAGVSPEAVQAAVFAAGPEDAYDRGQISSRDFYKTIMDRFGLDLPYPLFCRLWCEIFDPMKGMASVVEHLSAHYPLFLLSNTNELHFIYIRQHFPAILRPFRSFILSYEVGSRKPEPAIYRELVRRAGCTPDKILYLDDKLPFVEAAQAEGLQSWQFTAPEELVRALKKSQLWDAD